MTATFHVGDAQGFLRCSTCGRAELLDAAGIGFYLRNGWRKCHGYTMTWITGSEVAIETPWHHVHLEYDEATGGYSYIEFCEIADCGVER